jgi:hypothetical protein
MGFDKRQNIQVPTISAEDVKDAQKLADFLNDIGNKLNQRKSSRFLVKRVVNYTLLRQSADNLFPLIQVKDLGFVPSAIVLAGVFPTDASFNMTRDLTNDFIITSVQLGSQTCSFRLEGGDSNDIGKTVSIAVLVFETDSVQPNTGNALNTGINQTLRKRF